MHFSVGIFLFKKGQKLLNCILLLVSQPVFVMFIVTAIALYEAPPN